MPSLASKPRYPVTIEGETAVIGTANELAIALDVLYGQHDRAILEQLCPHLAEIVGNAAGLTNVLRVLEPADQIVLIQAIGDQLPAVLHHARFLRDLFAILADETVEQCLLETLGADGIRTLIVTASELGEVLEWLYGQRDQQLLNLLGTSYLKRLIRTGEDLACVLNGLAEPAQADLIEQLGWPLNYYKHVLTPLNFEEMAHHPEAPVLQHIRQSCQHLEINGPNTVIFVLPDGRMGVVADSKKLRPLVIGKDDCMVAAASEVCGLNMVIPSRDHERDVYPGERETVMVDNGLEIERWPQ